MFLTETHMHTYPTSKCSHFSPKEAVERYSKEGYSTLIITDHFSANFGVDTDLSWDEKFELFFEGYKEARAVGDLLGVCVLPAMELTMRTTPNDYLLYGVNKEFFERVGLPDVFDMTPAEIYPHAKATGITVVQAHPYRGRCYPTPDCVDALEVINTSPRHDNRTEEIMAVALQHGLPMTGGSDAHRPEDVARGGVITEKQILTLEDYVNALYSGALQLKGRELV